MKYMNYFEILQVNVTSCKNQKNVSIIYEITFLSIY